MNNKSKMVPGSLFGYLYNGKWYCILIAYKNVWSQFPMSLNTTVNFLFNKEFDILPELSEGIDLADCNIIPFRTILPSRKPKQYVYIGERLIPDVDIGLKGDGIFISANEKDIYKDNASIVCLDDGSTIAVPYYDLSGNRMDHMPAVKVGNAVFHCTKGVESILQMIKDGKDFDVM